MNAKTVIDEALRAVFPEGVPPSYVSIDTASFIGSGRARRAVGNLTMFDGAPAIVHVWQSGICTAHRFISLPGGDVSFEDGKWQRVQRDTDQLEPSLSAA